MTSVVHLITSLEVGGAQEMLRKLLLRTDRERFPSRVVSLLDGGPLAGELARAGIEVRSLGMSAGVPDPRAVLRLRALLARWSPDVLQTWLYHADVIGLVAAWVAGIETVAWNLRCTHDPERRGGERGGLAARLAPRMCARLSGRPAVIVTNSEAGRETHAAIGYRPRRWLLIPNGFELDRFRPDPEARRALLAELGLEGDAVLAGVVARFHPMKNHAGVLRAAERLAEEQPQLVFALAGTGVTLEDPEFRELHERCGAPGNVRFLGERRDLPAVMAGLDFLVSASGFLEGFPNVLGEALSAGTPCVATDVGDSAQVLGEAGILVPAADDDALREAIERLARLSPEERAALGAAGRRRMEERYDIGDVVRRYEALYAELAAGAPCAV